MADFLRIFFRSSNFVDSQQIENSLRISSCTKTGEFGRICIKLGLSSYNTEALFFALLHLCQSVWRYFMISILVSTPMSFMQNLRLKTSFFRLATPITHISVCFQPRRLLLFLFRHEISSTSKIYTMRVFTNSFCKVDLLQGHVKTAVWNFQPITEHRESSRWL